MNLVDYTALEIIYITVIGLLTYETTKKFDLTSSLRSNKGARMSLVNYAWKKMVCQHVHTATVRLEKQPIRTET